MKTIFLLRHAKSSWDQPGLPDIHRPLAPRGRKAAAAMGSYMVRTGLSPDLVLCSAALRARETWEIVSRSLGGGIPVEIREDLYHASAGSLLTLVRGLDPTVREVMLVGHNPTFEELALTLAGGGDRTSMEALHRKFPTGALAILDFRVGDWREVLEGGGHLRAFVRPKDLTSP